MIHLYWISGDVDPVLTKKTDPGSVPQTKRFSKFYKMNILDNIKSLLFCFHTFGVRRSINVLDSENQPGSGSAFIQCGSWYRALGFTEDVWHQKHENKKECFQKDLKFYNIWKNLSSFEVQSPWSGFWLKPDPHHWKLETKCYEFTHLY